MQLSSIQGALQAGCSKIGNGVVQVGAGLKAVATQVGRVAIAILGGLKYGAVKTGTAAVALVSGHPLLTAGAVGAVIGAVALRACQIQIARARRA